MGLAAALAARRRGFEPTVFEKGRVGEALHHWGSARLFSPLGRNVPSEALRLVGKGLDPEALLTGPELVERVLLPLAASEPLAGRVRTGVRVVAVARAGMTRAELPSHPLRSERPFRLLLEEGSREEIVEADAVLDASGVTGQPCFAGPGGLPAPGERGLGGRVLRSLGDVERGLPRLAGASVLLIGHGHSAATAIGWLAAVAARNPRTAITWAVRTGHRRPCAEVAADPLPERQRIAGGANDLAAEPPAFLRVERRAVLASLAEDGARIRATFSGGRGGAFDAVVALTGWRPDLAFLSELALEISPVTEGSRGLARALASVTDCLAVPAVEPADLASGEPGFFLIGAKSYGRSRNFLLQTGLAQLEAVLDCLAGMPEEATRRSAAVFGKDRAVPRGSDLR